MGQDLSMIVHGCGMNIDNSRENKEQMNLINSILLFKMIKRIQIVIY
jgi:hypothetical protein